MEQVIQLLVINLKEGAVDGIAVLLLHMSKALEQMLDCSRDDTVFLLVTQEWVCTALLYLEAVPKHVGTVATHCVLVAHVVVPMRTKHSKSFTRTCLSICKNG